MPTITGEELRMKFQSCRLVRIGKLQASQNPSYNYLIISYTYFVCYITILSWQVTGKLNSCPYRNVSHIAWRPPYEWKEQLLRTHSLEGTIEECGQNEEEDRNDTKQHHNPTGERRSVGGRRRGRRWVRRTGQRAVRGRGLRLWSLRRS